MSRRQRREAPRLPRYEVLRTLGRGGSGSVYLARDLLDGRREIALKLCHDRISPAEILGEFRVLRQLRHPGIARAFDFGHVPGSGSAYFTMEFVPGPDLAKRSEALRKEDLVPDSLLDIFLQITRVLAYLHRKSVLHLDLKPSNVVLAEGVAKLIDLGLFQKAGAGRLSPRGTALFTAPEVFEGAAVDARTDLYSLGVTFYHCLTGKYPIVGKTPEEIARNHRDATPIPIAGVPSWLGAMTMKLLAKSPRQRFQTAEEVEDALLEARASLRHGRAPSFEGLDFVGRKKEFDRFFTWVEAFRKDGGPAFLEVEAEPGMGRSRYIDACATELLGLGIHVIPITPSTGEDYGGLRQLVEKLLVLFPIERKRRSAFRFLFTRLGISSSPTARKEIQGLGLEQIRARTHGEVLALLELLVPAPSVIVIDDLHRSDPELRGLVDHIAKRPAPMPGLRNIGFLVSRLSEVTAKQRESRSGFARDARVRLEPLRRPECTEALGQLAKVVGERGVAEISGAARGNPGLLAQLAYRTLEREGHTGRPSPDLQSLLEERLEKLGEAERELILLLAALDRPAPESLLKGLSGLRGAAYEETRRSLRRAGLLKGAAHGYYLPEAVRRYALEGAQPAELREIHGRIGLRLRGDPRRRRDAALHLLRAGRERDGLPLAREAAEELTLDGRVVEALALHREALEHAGTSRERCYHLEKQGDLLEKSGRFDEAGASYDLLLSDADLDTGDRLRILRKRGGIHQRSGDAFAARRAFEDALRLVDDAGNASEHLHLLNELAALHLFQGEYPRSTTYANRGMEILRSDEAADLDEEERAFHALNFHSVAGHILLRQFEYDRAAKEFQRGLEFSERIGSLSNTALILNNLGIAYHQSSRLGEALRVYDRAARLARRMGDETALFSIRCNVAGIRARRGELRAAGSILAELEDMPHSRRSRRARLFLLHTRGLVARLALTDARAVWEEAIRLAEEIPEPLFAAYGRTHLLENEIAHGHWKHAREILGELRKLENDARLRRSIACREAWLEALCDRPAESRSLLGTARAVLSSHGRPAHGDLWETVLAGAALVELGDLQEAESALRKAKRAFSRSRQHPPALECSLLLAEVALRQRRPEQALRRIADAKKSFAEHDTDQGSRNALARIPFLEARAVLQSSPRDPDSVAEKLVEVSANLPFDCSQEIVWLRELVRSESGGVESAGGSLESARRAFLSELSPSDRKRYLGRDHRARLGLAPPGRRRAGSSGSSRAERRLRALMKLHQTRDTNRALHCLLEACDAPRGAVFLEESGRHPPNGHIVVARKPPGKAKLEALRRQALRIGSGRAGEGFFAEIRAPGRSRSGVLWLDPDRSHVKDSRELQEFLDLAGEVMARLVPPTPAGSAFQSTALLEGPERTRTLAPTTFVGGDSPRTAELMTLVERTRRSQLPVLLTGESGSGKDHLARWIHGLSSRRDGPFLALECSAIPENLLEAELFGHEPGAFTGADRSRDGYLRAAHGGTLYIDNVDALPLSVQTKLLRLLESGEFRRLGGRETERVEARFIASTQRDLKELSGRDEFRSDLYFRLAGICLVVPPLRERVEDIPRLVAHFLAQQGPESLLELTPEAMEALKAHSWPGNVRELETVLRRLALTAEGPVGREETLHALGIGPQASTFPRWIFEGQTYEEALALVKREYLLHLFERFDGDVREIARELQTTKRNVYLRLAQAGLRPSELRER